MFATKFSAGSVAGVILLSACTASNADSCSKANREISLGNLAGNVLSGAYEDCIDRLQQDLNALRLEGRQLQGEALRLDTLSASLSGEERSAATRLAELNATQAELVARIAQASEAGASEAQIERLVSAESALRRQIGSSGDGVDPATAEAIAQRQRNLNQLTLDLL
ncbi:hypothetical protein N9571_01250 [Yoonia sp.]|nr:hypothetical protein [Yoonia sp.]